MKLLVEVARQLYVVQASTQRGQGHLVQFRTVPNLLHLTVERKYGIGVGKVL